MGGIAQRGALWVLGSHRFAELAGLHHFYPLIGIANGKRTGILHLHPVLGPLLGGDDDDPVGSSRPVDGGSRGILQHGKGFDVVGIDGGQGVGCARSGVVAHRYPVDDNQRVVAGIERSPTTDADAASGSRLTIGCRDIKPRYTALYQLLRRGDGSLVQFVGLDGHHGTAQVVLLHRAIPDDHYFVQQFRIFFQDDVHEGLCRQFLGLIAHERHHEGHFRVGTELEVTVQVGNGALGGSFHQDVRTDHWLSRRILHRSADGYLLREGLGPSQAPHQQQQEGFP